MYEEDSESVEEVLNEMRTKPFKSLESHSRGTQLKFVVEFEGGGKAMLKPMRFPRNLTVFISLIFYLSDLSCLTRLTRLTHLTRLIHQSS
jgi:hypothetical protein